LLVSDDFWISINCSRGSSVLPLRSDVPPRPKYIGGGSNPNGGGGGGGGADRWSVGGSGGDDSDCELPLSGR